MQISLQEVERVLRRERRAVEPASRPARSVSELAQRYGITEAEVRRIAAAVQEAEGDPWRARRVRELAARVEAGTYEADAAAIVDMAERRAAADRAGGV